MPDDVTVHDAAQAFRAAVPDDVTIEEAAVGPVVRPPADAGIVVLYLHGEPDDPEPALDLARRLALRTGATVVCPHYRPAFPAALIDAHSGYSYCQAVDPVVVVLGEGLGAALATAMVVQLRDSEATPPQCVVLLSPLLDLTLEARSLQLNAGAGALFDVTELRRRVRDYARHTPLSDSRLSPLYANLHGLPPVQLLAAGTDPLLDDTLAFATRAARSRVAVDLRVWPEAAAFRTEVVDVMARFLTTAHQAGAPA